MTTSKQTLRQSLAKKVPGAYVGTASSDSTGTTEILDTDDDFITFAGDGATDLTGYWVIRPDAATADRVRRITRHDPNIGRMVVSRAYAASADGETYELWPPDMRPGLVDDAIDDGQKRLTYRVEDTVTLSSNDNNYALSSLTWITSERDVREVWAQYTSSNLVTRQPWPWWDVWDDSGTFTLSLDPPPYTTSGISCIVEGKARYSALASHSSTTSANADWSVAAAQVELYRKLVRDLKGEPNPAWAGDYMEARREFHRLSRRYAPRVPRRSVKYRSPTRMPDVGLTRRGEYIY